MLTGRTALRTTWRGKLVLQVEEQQLAGDPTNGVVHPLTRWRDAREQDIPALHRAHAILAPREYNNHG